MFQDIRMPRKSLREVLPKGASEKIKKARRVEPEEAITSRPRVRSYRKPRSHKLIWLAIVLVLMVAAGFFFSKAFATVLVEVTPKQYEVALNSSAFTVPYESVTILPIKEAKTVTAKLGTGVPKKASGTIVIYNNYNNKPQTLIANTRFQAASGKIYRISKQVTVPGTKISGGKTVAGQVEAVVTADVAGSSYNCGLTDFTIPGFKGDPRFNKFSAKSKTAMTGGSDGKEWVADPTERDQAVTELKKTLLQKAAEQVRFQIPENFLVYDATIVPTFKEDLSAVEGNFNQATLTMSLEAEAIIFDREVLSQALVSSSLPGGPDQPFVITNLDKLSITLDDNSLKSDDKKVTITADGKANVKLTVDPSLLRSRLVAVDPSQTEEIFKQFPGLLKADVSFQPPWIRSFPGDAEKIKVVIP